MSDLTVYGNVFSQPTRSVLTFCRLSGIEHTHKDLNFLKREHLSEEFTLINPFQAMPAIVHGTFNLWESAAIVPYLADSYNVDNQWYPKDLKIRARINAYLHWHHQGTRDPIVSYLRAKLFAPKFGAPELTEETEAPYKAKLEEWYETFTWVLSETHYAARTATPTIADVFAYNEVFNAMPIMNLDAHPAIKAWFDELSAVPIIREIGQEAQEVYRKFLS